MSNYSKARGLNGLLTTLFVIALAVVAIGTIANGARNMFNNAADKINNAGTPTKTK